MNTFARPELQNKEREQGPKPEIGDLEDVAGPDLMGVVVEEGSPALAMFMRWSSLAHILLHRALADLDAQVHYLPKGSAPLPTADSRRPWS